jgi:ATP-dependent exoDNAse (exonuclease V) beta subunit
MDLLSRREGPESGLGAAAARVRAGGGVHEDGAGVRWVFPALGPAPAPAGATGATLELPSPAEVGRQGEVLAKLRRDAEAREAQAFSAPASRDAHALLGAALLEGVEDEEAASSRSSGAGSHRSVAAAVGVAVHRVLESLDPEGDLAAQIAAAGRLLPEVLEGLLPPDLQAGARARARDVLERLARGPLLARLKAIGPHIVARELPVLLPPGDDPGAPAGFVSGTIDLVYRDPDTGEVVIADYKTDEVPTEEEFAGRVAAYALQGASYRRALREALALPGEPRFELWFLQADRIERVEP